MLTLLLAVVTGVSTFSNPVEAIPHPGLQARQATSYVNYINQTRNNDNNVELKISTQGGGRNATAPLLYGWMFEDISVSTLTLLTYSSIYSMLFSTPGRVDYMLK